MALLGFLVVVAITLLLFTVESVQYVLSRFCGRDIRTDNGQIDMGSDGGPTDPLYPYHSNYDSYHWMATYGDPGFHIHAAMGEYLSLLAYNLATAELIPFDLLNYADQMDIYFDELSEVISSGSGNVSVSELRDAIDTFRTQANEVVELSQLAISSNDTELMQVVNHKYRDFQRGFTSQGGLPNREFYQHTIFAPGIDTGKLDHEQFFKYLLKCVGYAPVTFPGITEAIDAGNYTLAQEWVHKTSAAIGVAGNIIKT
jgi:N-acetylated-alpha-linked acidic dipeptidase